MALTLFKTTALAMKAGCEIALINHSTSRIKDTSNKSCRSVKFKTRDLGQELTITSAAVSSLSHKTARTEIEVEEVRSSSTTKSYWLTMSPSNSIWCSIKSECLMNHLIYSPPLTATLLSGSSRTTWKNSTSISKRGQRFCHVFRELFLVILIGEIDVILLPGRVILK